jgi:twinkle protein
MDFKEVGINSRLKNGTNYVTCPECSHSRTKKDDKCLTVHVEVGNNWWNCHHCGFKGNLEVHKRSSQVREAANMPKSKVSQLSSEVLSLFASKGIETRIALDLGWYELKDTKGRHFLCVPLFGRNGQTYNVKFRCLNDPNYPKFTQVPKDSGSQSTLMGLHDLEIDPETGTIPLLFICEGETDLATWKRFHKNTVSVPMGAPSVNAKDFEEEFKYLEHESFVDLLSIVEYFVIAVDGDEAGNLLKNELIKRIGKKKCKFISYPKGQKDINDVYLQLGVEGVDEVMATLDAVPFEGIINPMDLSYEISEIDKYGIAKGDPIGFKEIDRLYTLKAPYLYVVTGVPGSGKSTFNRFHLVNYAKRNGKKVGLFTPEQRPYGREVIKIIEVYTGKNYKDLTEQEKASAMAWASATFSFIVPTKNSYKELTKIKNPSESNTLTAVLEYVEILKKTKGVSGYVVDAWNKLEHEIPRGDTEHNYTGKSIDAILNFNEEHDLWCIIVAHPRKIDKKASGNYYKPSLYHISGSAHWYNKADVGIIVHRDRFKEGGDNSYYRDPDSPTEVITEKIKFEELGEEGEITIFFNNNNNCYTDTPPFTKSKRAEISFTEPKKTDDYIPHYDFPSSDEPDF